MSYALLGIGLALSFMIMTLYWQRLALHHLPNAEVTPGRHKGIPPHCDTDPIVYVVYTGVLFGVVVSSLPGTSHASLCAGNHAKLCGGLLHFGSCLLPVEATLVRTLADRGVYSCAPCIIQAHGEQSLSQAEPARRRASRRSCR